LLVGSALNRDPDIGPKERGLDMEVKRTMKLRVLGPARAAVPALANGAGRAAVKHRDGSDSWFYVGAKVSIFKGRWVAEVIVDIRPEVPSGGAAVVTGDSRDPVTSSAEDRAETL
jgi:hypothetical protein